MSQVTMTRLVGFAHALRAAGVAASPQRVAGYLQAVQQVDIAKPAQLYWAGRATLCSGHDDLDRYDAAFAHWFGSAPAADAAARPAGRPGTLRAVLPAAGQETSGGETTRGLNVAASETERLRHRDVSELSAEEARQLRELMATLRPRPPMRRGTRRRPARSGELDPHRTLRAMLASGGEPVRLRRRSRRVRPRRVVLLLDTSGSMQPYAETVLRLAHVMTRRSPASTETFTIGTRLTRITAALANRDPEQGVAAAGRTVPDYAGGTRLGAGLAEFGALWGRTGMARGAVVVIFSDGWERGGCEQLAIELARLRRLAHALLWVNPHAGHEGYAPVQSGIAAAWPHIDRLLAGHSLATFEELLSEVADA